MKRRRERPEPLPLTDFEAEQVALACLLLRPELVGRVELAPRDFHAGAHQQIFAACRRVAQERGGGSYMRGVPKGRDCALVRVLAALRESCRLASVDGAGYVVELLGALDREGEGMVRAMGLSAVFEASASRVRRLAEGRRALGDLDRARIDLAHGDWRSVGAALEPVRKWLAPPPSTSVATGQRGRGRAA